MKKIAVMLMVLSLLLGCIGATAETFEGVGTGNGGDIKVAITVEDGKITAIDVLEQNETAGISDGAFAQIPDAIIANQSLAVDTVTGATNSSNGILAAVEAAATAAGWMSTP